MKRSVLGCRTVEVRLIILARDWSITVRGEGGVAELLTESGELWLKDNSR